MEPMQDEWVVLKEWSGENGTTVTEKFTTPDRVFRVSWRATELDRGGLLDVYVWSEAKRLIMLAAGLQDHVIGCHRLLVGLGQLGEAHPVVLARLQRGPEPGNRGIDRRGVGQGRPGWGGDHRGRPGYVY